MHVQVHPNRKRPVRVWVDERSDDGTLVVRFRGSGVRYPRSVRLDDESGVFETQLDEMASLQSFLKSDSDKVDCTPDAVLKWLSSSSSSSSSSSPAASSEEKPNWDELGTEALRLGAMPHQRLAVDRIVGPLRGRAFVSMPTGTGKSLVAAAVAAHYAGKTLVLSTVTAQHQWVAEFHRWTHMTARCVNGSEVGDPSLLPENVLVATYATLRLNDLMRKARWKTVIVDESHNVGGKCATSDAVAEACVHARCVLMVSATPMKARPAELFNQLRCVLPKVFTNRSAFEARYCDGKMNRWNFYEASGATNTEELNVVMKRSCVNCNKFEALGDLPPLTVHEITLPVEPDVLEEFVKLNEKWQDLSKKIDEAPPHLKERAKQARDALSMAMYVRTGVVKIPASVDWLLGLLSKRDETEKVVVFATHVAVIEAVCEALGNAGIKYVSVDGSTAIKKRQAALEAIRDPHDKSARVAVLTLGTSAESLNLCPGANIVVQIQLSHTPAVNTQCLGRVWRKGQTRPVDAYRLIAPGTNDDTVVRINASKQRTADKLFFKSA